MSQSNDEYLEEHKDKILLKANCVINHIANLNEDIFRSKKIINSKLYYSSLNLLKEFMDEIYGKNWLESEIQFEKELGRNE